ncbi:CDP-alcohol phosphatidyltransferase [Haloechinothrix alba]|uniref:CDP-alcohol phosphatidyltransferase n=1 Tax=Haloechinothrix alba TaxID=664784 RepID=A0A238WZR8_9PSEU|nr:CDP-alcohol phosphatidyltransferase family protein [Haloechinothrix alba]SNR52066.1 CDP-alcohol phosphatidyltransferase [Haloechinothrix alba]
MTNATTPDFTTALARLRDAQKSTKGAPAYSRFINREAGRVLAAAAFTANLTPNRVTAISAVFTFGGIGLIATAPPTPLLGLAVAAALVLGYALDAADGQLARLRGGGTPEGEWLDHVVDSIKISALHLAVLIALYRHFDVTTEFLLVPLGFHLVAAVMFFTMILNEQLRRRHTTPDRVAAETGSSPVRSLLVLPTDYGVLCLLFVTLGFARVFPIGYAALFVANAAFLAAALVKWYKDVSALGRAGTAPEGRYTS